MITSVQMRKLYDVIRKSPDADETTKKALIWAFRKTRRLTTPVVILIPNPAITEQVRNGAHDMVSATGATHLNDFLKGAGSNFVVHDVRHELGVLISRNSWFKNLQKGTKVLHLNVRRLEMTKL